MDKNLLLSHYLSHIIAKKFWIGFFLLTRRIHRQMLHKNRTKFSEKFNKIDKFLSYSYLNIVIKLTKSIKRTTQRRKTVPSPTHCIKSIFVLQYKWLHRYGGYEGTLFKFDQTAAVSTCSLYKKSFKIKNYFYKILCF